MAKRLAPDDSDAIYLTASGLMQQTVNARGYVQMPVSVAILIAATLRGLSRSTYAADIMSEAESNPNGAAQTTRDAIRNYVDRVRKSTIADQQEEATLLAQTVAATKT